MSKCAREGCDNGGKHKCSICLRELYCSGNCQKIDWKSHKLICKSLKKLSHELQPYAEVIRIIEETKKEKPKKIDLDIRFVNHLISYAWHQFGDRIPGKAYRERVNGERINNWNVEIKILLPIYDRINISDESHELLSLIDIDNISFPSLEKMLELLRPWSVNLDMDSTGRIDNLDQGQIERLLSILSEIECQIALIHTRRRQFNQAEDHCQRALSYARLYEGKDESKTDLLCTALRVYINLQKVQGNYADAITYTEEAYNLVAVAYNPVHPKVQAAASTLIECLIHAGDLFNAERFAQATLDSLKDPGNGLDQESDEVAKGYYDYANVISELKGDFVKAERLARESLRIRSQLYCHDHQIVGDSVSVLADILHAQGKLDDETKELYERSLTIYMKHSGPDGKNTGVTNINMGNFYRDLAGIQQAVETKMSYLRLYLSYYKEAMRIYTQILGPDNPKTMRLSSAVLVILRELSEA